MMLIEQVLPILPGDMVEEGTTGVDMSKGGMGNEAVVVLSLLVLRLLPLVGTMVVPDMSVVAAMEASVCVRSLWEFERVDVFEL
jgi:hypothetical protein